MSFPWLTRSTCRFLLKRLVGLIFVIIGVSFLTFIMGYFAPGDPILALLGPRFDWATYHHLKHIYGLDLPWWQQYYNYLVGMLQGNFGYSFHYQERGVWDIIQPGLPTSIELGVESLAISLIIGIPLGILCALRPNSYTDTIVTSTVMTLYAIPNLILIVAFQACMLWLASNNLPHLPLYGWDNLQERIAPVLITASASAGYFTRLIRTSILEVLGQDFIRTARAKGLREQIVIARHTMRYAFIPILTAIGPSLGYLVTGIYITERFFEIPGVAQTTLTAIGERDYPVLQASVILTGFSIVVFNALTDVAYAFFDPRIRIE
jgi:ABC-type dipeptide/oligopeptide/nickel transport system permease component